MSDFMLVGRNVSEFRLKAELWEPENFPSTKLYAIVNDPTLLDGFNIYPLLAENKLTMRGYLCHVDLNGFIVKNVGVKEWTYSKEKAYLLIESILEAFIIGTEVKIKDKILDSLTNEENTLAFEELADNCVPPFIKPE